MASDLSARSINFFISSPRVLDGDMFLTTSYRCTKDDVLFQIFHCLFGSLTADYRPFHSQESVCRFFEKLYKLAFVASNRLT